MSHWDGWSGITSIIPRGKLKKKRKTDGLVPLPSQLCIERCVMKFPIIAILNKTLSSQLSLFFHMTGYSSKVLFVPLSTVFVYLFILLLLSLDFLLHVIIVLTSVRRFLC